MSENDGAPAQQGSDLVETVPVPPVAITEPEGVSPQQQQKGAATRTEFKNQLAEAGSNQHAKEERDVARVTQIQKEATDPPPSPSSQKRPTSRIDPLHPPKSPSSRIETASPRKHEVGKDDNNKAGCSFPSPSSYGTETNPGAQARAHTASKREFRRVLTYIFSQDPGHPRDGTGKPRTALNPHGAGRKRKDHKSATELEVFAQASTQGLTERRDVSARHIGVPDEKANARKDDKEASVAAKREAMLYGLRKGGRGPVKPDMGVTPRPVPHKKKKKLPGILSVPKPTLHVTSTRKSPRVTVTPAKNIEIREVRRLKTAHLAPTGGSHTGYRAAHDVCRVITDFSKLVAAQHHGGRHANEPVFQTTSRMGPSVELAQASDAAKIWLDKIRADDTSLRRLPASGAIEKTRLIREGKLIKSLQVKTGTAAYSHNAATSIKKLASEVISIVTKFPRPQAEMKVHTAAFDGALGRIRGYVERAKVITIESRSRSLAQQVRDVIGARDSNGLVPLEYAIATSDCLELVTMFHNEGFDVVNYRCLEDGHTLAMRAAFFGRPKVLGYILKMGGSAVELDSRGASLAHMTSHKDSLQCLKEVARGICRELGLKDSDRLPRKFRALHDHRGMTPLHWAAAHAAPHHIRELIKLGADIMLPEARGRNALHIACINSGGTVTDSRRDVVRMIAERGSQIFHKMMLTSVERSGQEKHSDVENATSVIDRNGNPLPPPTRSQLSLHIWNRPDNLRCTPLHYLMTMQSPQCISEALQPSSWYDGYIAEAYHESVPDFCARDHSLRTPLHWLVAFGPGRSGSFDVMYDVFKACDALQLREALAAADAGGWTVLHYAAHSKGSKTMSELLESRVAVPSRSSTPSDGSSTVGWQLKELCNTCDNEGLVPLIVASLVGNRNAVQALLVEGNADVSIFSHAGLTAVHAAARLGDSKIVRMLIEAGCDPNFSGSSGEMPSALALACIHSHDTVVNVLFKKSPDMMMVSIDRPDGHGQRPLAAAALGGHVGIFTEILLRAPHADFVNRADNAGRTAMHAAMICEKPTHGTGPSKTNPRGAMIKALLVRGGRFGAKDEFGRTPLHYAAMNLHHPGAAIRTANKTQGMALEDGFGVGVCSAVGTIDWSPRDGDGLTPLDYAIAASNTEAQVTIKQLGGRTSAELSNANTIRIPWGASDVRKALILSNNMKQKNQNHEVKTFQNGVWMTPAPPTSTDHQRSE